MSINRTLTTVIAATAFAAPALAEGELNLYSSRHYDTDERLYSDFTEATGITINRIEGKGDELIARMQAEGTNSPADVLLTVDTTRLQRAKDAGVLQSIENATLEERIPSNLQDADNQWFGFSHAHASSFTTKPTLQTRPWITLPWPTLPTKAWCATVRPRTSIPRRCYLL